MNEGHKANKVPPCLFFFGVTALAAAFGSVGSILGMPAYEALQKPPLTPPSPVFPIVWGILYFLMALGAALVWNTGDLDRKKAAALYLVQLIMNSLWSWLFFAAQALFLSFLWLAALWALIFLMVRAFYAVRPLAAYLQIPYLLWVAFAGYLNLGIFLLNPK